MCCKASKVRSPMYGLGSMTSHGSRCAARTLPNVQVLSLTDIMDKMVMDDWGQAKAGPYGSLRAHVDAGKLSEHTLHAELGQIVAGLKPGRQSDEETNLFWHRGLSLSDIALGAFMLEKAKSLGLGQRLRFR